jgi:hypothetical protein
VGDTCSATLDVTIVPSGRTTTKNWFIGSATVECSPHPLAAGNFPPTISDPVKLPNESRLRILKTAITIAATVTDNRIKAILCKFVRLIVQIGCRIDPPLTRLPIFISLDMRRTRSGDQDGHLRYSLQRTARGSIEEPPPTKSS